MRVFPVTALAALVAALVPVGGATASFQPLDGRINLDPAHSLGQTSLANVGGVPWVAWTERTAPGVQGNNQLMVKKFEAGSWQAVGGVVNVDPVRSSFFPSLANITGDLIIGGIPGGRYIAWVEHAATPTGESQLRVRRFNGTTWVNAGNGASLNFDTGEFASDPTIANVRGLASSGHPYVSWSEFNGTATQLRVRTFDGANWPYVPAAGTSLNVNPTHPAPYGGSIASVGGSGLLTAGQPWVAFAEYSETQTTGGGIYQVFVRRFDSTANLWLLVGGVLNFDSAKTAGAPSMVNIAGVPYVAWGEQRQESTGLVHQVRVKRYDGANWVSVGGAVNPDPPSNAFDVAITNVGGEPWVAYTDQLGGGKNVARVSRFDGSRWVPVGEGLNLDGITSAQSAGLVDAGGATAGLFNGPELRVLREVAPQCSGSSATTSRDTALAVTLTCNEGMRAVVTGPAHGSLSGLDAATGAATYIPATGYTGTDSIAFKSNDGALDSNVATLDIDIAAPVGPAGTPSPPAAIATIAKLGALRATSKRFAVGPAATPRTGQTAARRKSVRGTTWSFTLDQTATVTVTINSARPGRRSGSKCLSPTRRLRGAKKCTRFVRVGALSRTGHAGLNKVAFSGRLGRTPLKPGRHSAVFSAGNAAGTSKPATLTFTIAKS